MHPCQSDMATLLPILVAAASNKCGSAAALDHAAWLHGLLGMAIAWFPNSGGSGIPQAIAARHAVDLWRRCFRRRMNRHQEAHVFSTLRNVERL